MRDWKEIAEFLHREVCMNFRNLPRVGVLLFWKRETVCLWNLKLATCEFVFFEWFSFMWMVICGVCCRCRTFMLATVDLMTCLRVFAKPLWPVDHFMFAFHVHDSCLCCCECRYGSLFMRSSMEWRSMSFIFDQKSFQFPMEWDWRNGFKIREDNWSYIEVKLRVRKIPVCWKHLEFWETFGSFIYLLDVTWCLELWLLEDAQALLAARAFE